MGADLYIDKMDRNAQYTGFEVSDRAVMTGYFRDCYNETGLFRNLGLSWWKSVDEYFPNGMLKLKDIPKFKALIEAAHTSTIRNKESVFCKKKTKKEYEDWYNLLIKFLDLAVEKKSGIIMSV